MPKTDLVPCFYLEQDETWETPAYLRLRSEVHQLKQAKLGKFINHGTAFRLFKNQTAAVRQSYFEGPLGIGNLLPFSRIPNGTEKHHYPVPACGDHRIQWMNSFIDTAVRRPSPTAMAG